MSRSGAPRRPPELVLAAIVLGMFALALAVIGVQSLADAHGAFSAGIGGLLLALAALVALAAWGLWGVRRWSRGAGVASALTVGAVAFSNLSYGWLAWLALALAVACLAGMLTPRATRALDPPFSGDPDA